MSLAESVFYVWWFQCIKVTVGEEDKLLCCMYLSPFCLPGVSISQGWTRSQLETKVQLIALDNSDLDAGLNHIPFEGTKKCQKNCVSFEVPWNIKLTFRPLRNLELFRYYSFLVRHLNLSVLNICLNDFPRIVYFSWACFCRKQSKWSISVWT